MIKKLNKYLAGSLVALSIISIGHVAKADHIDTVLFRWQRVQQTTTNNKTLVYEEDHQYKNITYRNGYTYTQSVKDITTFWDRLGGVDSRKQYVRDFSTY